MITSSLKSPPPVRVSCSFVIALSVARVHCRRRPARPRGCRARRIVIARAAPGRETDGAHMVTRTWAMPGARGMRGRPRIPARVPRQAGEVRGWRRRSGRRRAAVEVLADEGLEGAEVALGEVLEAASRRGDGGLGGVEPGHGAEQVLVVLAELELDGPGELRGAGEVQGGAGPIPPGLHQRAKAQSREPLRDRT